MPKRKLVLVIGMIDSIHLAKWLSRFESRIFLLGPSSVRALGLLAQVGNLFCRAVTSGLVAFTGRTVGTLSHGILGQLTR